VTYSRQASDAAFWLGLGPQFLRTPLSFSLSPPGESPVDCVRFEFVLPPALAAPALAVPDV
jgi:hypothetical protein